MAKQCIPTRPAHCSRFFNSVPHQDITALWNRANIIEFILSVFMLHEKEEICLRSQRFCGRTRKWHGIYSVPVQEITVEQINWRTECGFWSFDLATCNRSLCFLQDEPWQWDSSHLTWYATDSTENCFLIVVYGLPHCKADCFERILNSSSKTRPSFPLLLLLPISVISKSV